MCRFAGNAEDRFSRDEAQIFREKYYHFQHSSYKFAGSAVSVRPYMDKFK